MKLIIFLTVLTFSGFLALSPTSSGVQALENVPPTAQLAAVTTADETWWETELRTLEQKSTEAGVLIESSASVIALQCKMALETREAERTAAQVAHIRDYC